MAIESGFYELPYAEVESRFAAAGMKLTERTLNRWYAEALQELRQASPGQRD